jgi:hypothetical protein
VGVTLGLGARQRQTLAQHHIVAAVFAASLANQATFGGDGQLGGVCILQSGA